MGKFILLTSIRFISGRPSLPITALWVTRSLLTWGINCPSSTKEFQQQSQGPQKGWLLSAAVCRGEPQPGPVPWLLLCVVGQTHMSLSGQARSEGQRPGSWIFDTNHHSGLELGLVWCLTKDQFALGDLTGGKQLPKNIVSRIMWGLEVLHHDTRGRRSVLKTK